ncbi:MAG: hypothetical protein KDB82_12455 [Planctomycetes bacterium]|nr:hypothetical protein [Planctomycetota bacterium]
MLTLRVAVTATCIGTAARLLMYGGPVLSWLWMQHGWSENAAVKLEYAAAFGLLACIPFVFWRQAWPVLKLIAAWLLLSTFASMFTEPWHPELEPGAHAARYLAPLALAAFCAKDDERGRKLGEWLLRVGVGATFIAHGIEALLTRAQFIDYLIGGAWKLLQIDLPEGAARGILLTIGVVDVLVGAGVMLPKRWRVLALWLAFWGLLTASVRVLYLGWGNWPEMLIRVTNGAVPLTLFFLWTKAKHAQAE